MDLLSEPPFSLPKTFDAVDNAIDSNADIAEGILAAGLTRFGTKPSDESWKGQATPSDMDKARSTLRQLYRDWSAEGLPERHASYSPILSALETYLPPVSPPERHRHRILVPGAGLGRLVFDICAAGYTVEGNEISYHQILASTYVLNYTRSAGQHKLYPWALNFNNHGRRAAQLESVDVPDTNPGPALEEAARALHLDVHHSARMSLTAGDFNELYRRPDYRNCYDAVATCFFIDTAPNIITYIDTVKQCLKAGGVWINCGPLLWHHEPPPTPAERLKQSRSDGLHLHSDLDAVHEHGSGATQPGPQPDDSFRDAGSFELSDEEVVALVERLGFDVLEHKQAPAGATGYIQDPASMLQNVYRPSFWVARRR